MANKITEVSTKRGHDVRDTRHDRRRRRRADPRRLHRRQPGHHARWWCRRSPRSTAPSACSPWTSARTTRAPSSAARATSISTRSTACMRNWRPRRERRSGARRRCPTKVILKRTRRHALCRAVPRGRGRHGRRQAHPASGGRRRRRASRASTRSSTPSPCRGRPVEILTLALEGDHAERVRSRCRRSSKAAPIRAARSNAGAPAASTAATSTRRSTTARRSLPATSSAGRRSSRRPRRPSSSPRPMSARWTSTRTTS